jgi:DUF971 family protein
MNEVPQATVPLTVRAPVGSDVTEIDWADGHTGILPNELLRAYCPCAGCQGHSGEIRYIAGGNSVINALEEVGSYALQFTWGDGHASGIYTFRYLRRLCSCSKCLPGSPMASHEMISRSVT